MSSKKYLCIQGSQSGGCSPYSPSQMEEMYGKFTAWKAKFQTSIDDMGANWAAVPSLRPMVPRTALLWRPWRSWEASRSLRPSRWWARFAPEGSRSLTRRQSARSSRERYFGRPASAGAPCGSAAAPPLPTVAALTMVYATYTANRIAPNRRDN